MMRLLGVLGLLASSAAMPPLAQGGAFAAEVAALGRLNAAFAPSRKDDLNRVRRSGSQPRPGDSAV